MANVLIVGEEIEFKRPPAAVIAGCFLVPGAYHAFEYPSPEAPLSRQFASAWLEMLRRHLWPPASGPSN